MNNPLGGLDYFLVRKLRTKASQFVELALLFCGSCFLYFDFVLIFNAGLLSLLNSSLQNSVYCKPSLRGATSSTLKTASD